MKITLPSAAPEGTSFEIRNTGNEPIHIGVEQIPFGSTRTFRAAEGSQLSVEARQALDDYAHAMISTGTALQILVGLGIANAAAMALVNAVDFAAATRTNPGRSPAALPQNENEERSGDE